MVLAIYFTAGRISPEFQSLNWVFVSLNVVGNFQLQTNFFVCQAQSILKE